MKFIIVTLGLAAGNYIYQAFTGHNWGLATERSFFQAVAIGVMWLNGAR